MRFSSKRQGKAIDIGFDIHRAVLAEGRCLGVHAYLTTDGQGRSWFEKYDPKTKEFCRRFSPEIMERISFYRESLRIYAEWYHSQGVKTDADRPPGEGTDCDENQHRRNPGDDV